MRLSPRRDRFVVLASDGLYDEMSSSDVVKTVGQWMTGRGLIDRANPGFKVDGEEDVAETVDVNAASFLIRKALGVDIGKRLGIPAPFSRRNRCALTLLDSFL
jgi:hypothetical protein